MIEYFIGERNISAKGVLQFIMHNSKVAIVTDTVSSLPRDVAEEYGISVVPMHVIMDGRDYLETEVDKGQFYSWFEDEARHPKTSAPSIGDFLEVFRELNGESKHILCITMSSGISTTHKVALQARNMIHKESPSTTIEVIDSYNEHGAQMFVVLEAARAAVEGKDFYEVLKVAEGMIRRVTLFYLLDTIYHLKMGGRTGKAKIWEKTALSLKPLLELGIHTEGVTVPVPRLRTKSMGIKKIVEILEERVGDRELHAIITQGNVPDEAEELKERLLSSFQCSELYLTNTSLVPEVHQGPGALRLGFYCDCCE